MGILHLVARLECCKIGKLITLFHCHSKQGEIVRNKFIDLVFAPCSILLFLKHTI